MCDGKLSTVLRVVGCGGKLSTVLRQLLCVMVS